MFDATSTLYILHQPFNPWLTPNPPPLVFCPLLNPYLKFFTIPNFLLLKIAHWLEYTEEIINTVKKDMYFFVHNV